MNERKQSERSVTVSAYGTSAAALEEAAIAEARAFFGDDEAHLEVCAGYRAFYYPHDEPDRRYHASVTVREVTQP